MITLHLGGVGFHFLLTRKGQQKEQIFVLFLGIIGVCWWNKPAGKLYMHCLRLSVGDAALISDAPRAIRERVAQRTDEAISEERAHFEFWSERNDKEIRRLENANMEANTKVHELETTIREMLRVRDEV